MRLPILTLLMLAGLTACAPVTPETVETGVIPQQVENVSEIRIMGVEGSVVKVLIVLDSEGGSGEIAEAVEVTQQYTIRDETVRQFAFRVDRVIGDDTYNLNPMDISEALSTSSFYFSYGQLYNTTFNTTPTQLSLRLAPSS